MGFSEDDRIRYKNNKYMVKKAYEVLHRLQAMGYSGQELQAEIDKLLVTSETETQEDILKRAMNIAKDLEENKDDEESNKSSVGSFDYANGRMQRHSDSKPTS